MICGWFSKPRRDFSDRSLFAGLAVDSERQKLYYTDYEYQLIGELSTDGSNQRVLLNVTGYSRPRAIVLDSVNRFVMWLHCTLFDVCLVIQGWKISGYFQKYKKY